MTALNKSVAVKPAAGTPSASTPPPAERRRWRPSAALVLPLGVVVVLVALWYGLSAGGVVSEFALPQPNAVVSSIWNEPGGYWQNARTTLVEIGVGAFFGIVLGVGFGVMIALNDSLRRAFYPLLVASQSLPILAIAPLLVIWLGFGIAPKIVLVVQIIFFPITVATIQGLQSVSHEVLVFGRSLGASERTLFWKVRVPATLPHFFGGLKIASSYAAVAAVIAEWTGSEHGLGAMMLRANSDYNITVVFACVLIVTLIGLSLFGIVSLLERKLTPWHRDSRAR
jgi:NitT/TauT family transport system permease protein